ncbi:MAG: hypothetical protein WC462_04635 [archaeon]
MVLRQSNVSPKLVARKKLPLKGASITAKAVSLPLRKIFSDLRSRNCFAKSNAIISLSKFGEKYEGVIKNQFAHSDSFVKETILQVLFRINPKKHSEFIASNILHPDSNVAVQAISLSVDMKNRKVIPLLRKRALEKGANLNVRAMALRALAKEFGVMDEELHRALVEVKAKNPWLV